MSPVVVGITVFAVAVVVTVICPLPVCGYQRLSAISVTVYAYLADSVSDLSLVMVLI